MAGPRASDTAIQDVAGEHVLSWDFERVLFAMVLHRLVAPGSKLACNDWVAQEAWFPEGEGWDVHHFYRALDVLDTHADEVTEVIRKAAAAREEPDADGLVLRLVDTTSSYMETDEDDAERAAVEAGEAPDVTGDEREAEAEVEVEVEGEEDPLRMRGKSKDHRPNKPQVVVGMVCDGRGQPVAHRVYAGNTNDQKVTLDVVRLTQATWPEGRVVVDADSGMGGTPNLKGLDELRVDRVTGVPLRVLAKAEEMLRRPGRWRQHPTKKHFKFGSSTSRPTRPPPVVPRSGWRPATTATVVGCSRSSSGTRRRCAQRSRRTTTATTTGGRRASSSRHRGRVASSRSPSEASSRSTPRE